MALRIDLLNHLHTFFWQDLNSLCRIVCTAHNEIILSRIEALHGYGMLSRKVRLKGLVDTHIGSHVPIIQKKLVLECLLENTGLSNYFGIAILELSV